MSRAKAPDARQGRPNRAQTPAPPAPTPIEPPPPVPPAPEHLGAVGRALWQAIWEAGGHAYKHDTDRWIVERYCSLQDRRHHFMEVLSREGFTTTGSQGQVVAHPAARLLADVEAKLTPLEDRLGLSPEARFRLGVGAAQAKSALDAFLEEDPTAP